MILSTLVFFFAPSAFAVEDCSSAPGAFPSAFTFNTCQDLCVYDPVGDSLVCDASLSSCEFVGTPGIHLAAVAILEDHITIYGECSSTDPTKRFCCVQEVTANPIAEITLIGTDLGADELMFSDGAFTLKPPPNPGTRTGRLYGGAGNDHLTGSQTTSRYSEILYGGDGADDLFGLDGDDVLYGQMGADTLVGGSGGDTLYGGAHIDELFGDAGEDILRGGAGNDILHGGDHADLLYGDWNNDTLYGEDGDDFLYGGGGYDTLDGSWGDDHLEGGSHADTLIGGTGEDVLYGGQGHDTLYGGLHDDILYGDNGHDMMHGDAGNDELYGGAGNDTLYGGTYSDILLGEGGNDTLYGGGQRDWLFGGRGDDYLSGEGGDDVLWGDVGNDTHSGGVGSDILCDTEVDTTVTDPTTKFYGGELDPLTGIAVGWASDYDRAWLEPNGPTTVGGTNDIDEVTAGWDASLVLIAGGTVTPTSDPYPECLLIMGP